MELIINQNNSGKGYLEKTLASGRVKQTLLNRVAFGRQINAEIPKLVGGKRNPDYVGGKELKRQHAKYLIEEGGQATAQLGALLTSGKVIVQGVTNTAKGVTVNLLNKDTIDPDAIKEVEAKDRLEA